MIGDLYFGIFVTVAVLFWYVILFAMVKLSGVKISGVKIAKIPSGADPLIEDWELSNWKDYWTNFFRGTDETSYILTFSRKADIKFEGSYGASTTQTAQALFPKKGTLAGKPATITLPVYPDTLDYALAGVWFGGTRSTSLQNAAVAYVRMDNNEIFIQHTSAAGTLTGGSSSNSATKTVDVWQKVKMTITPNGGNFDITAGWYTSADVLIDSVTHQFTAAELPTNDWGLFISQTVGESVRIDYLKAVM